MLLAVAIGCIRELMGWNWSHTLVSLLPFPFADLQKPAQQQTDLQAEISTANHC